MDVPYIVDSDSINRRNERTAFLDREAAEVYLLLDFLSGRADRSLRPTQEELARSLLDQRSRPQTPESDADKQHVEIEDDLSDPTRLILRTMRIKYPIEPADGTFQADATFLMRARDVLNTRAWPASGLTIAFTSMVTGLSSGRQGGGEALADFAELAYPQYRKAAAALARWITRMIRLLTVCLVLALAISTYLAWGKVMLDTLDAVRRDGSAVQQELSSHQSSLLAAMRPGSLCDAQSASRPPVCDTVDDIKARYAVAAYQIAVWEWPLHQVTLDQEKDSTEQKQTEQWAIATMTVFGNYLMPALYGVLGSFAFALRRHHDRLEAHCLSPRDLRTIGIRLALGVLIGGCIGLVYSGTSAAQATGILGAAASLSAAGIAFLAGYGVEAVFKALDALIIQVFRVNGTDKPAQPGA